ncbi:MAG: 1-deoxy-D-xylulose-5-phosphate reductoisomerase [bacterium]|nr:1-deoxy-D-xylulose-5-phosphate reductoisomerase [bacterium]
MKKKKLIILGSTGSIGQSTVKVLLRHPDRFEVKGLAAYANIDRLEEQYRLFRPDQLCVIDPVRGEELATRLKSEPVEVLFGEEEAIKLAESSSAELIVNAIVGAAGLKASLAAIKSGKSLALANKESLVTGGPLFAPLVKRYGGKILPIDSEHSAIWQALYCGKAEEIRRIIITASGGPFREFPQDRFHEITPEMALDHPTWKMGPKITVDSATLANKGLEVMEAVSLFDITIDQVSVVVHPQSIVHSMVEYVDSSIIAQMSSPDMCLPISYALFWPDRVESEFGQLDPTSMSNLTFEPPNLDKFPALSHAFEAARAGGTAPAIFNAANEEAVSMFLKKGITFTDIADVIKNGLDSIEIVSQPDLNDILEADQAARDLVLQHVG